jgi:hypothetical protein
MVQETRKTQAAEFVHTACVLPVLCTIHRAKRGTTASRRGRFALPSASFRGIRGSL